MSSRDQIKLINDEFRNLLKNKYPNLILNLEYNLYVNNLEALPRVVPTSVIQKIKNKEVIFGIYLADEALTHYVDTIYKNLVLNIGLPPSQLLLVCSSPDYKDIIINIAKKYNTETIKAEYISVFEHQQKQLFLWYFTNQEYKSIADQVLPYKSSLQIKKFNKKFICFNRRWKEFRLATTVLLNNKNLLNDAYYSFPNSPVMADDLYYGRSDAFDKMLSDAKHQYPDLINELSYGENLKPLLPLVIDNKSFQTYFAFETNHRILTKYFKDTYFTLVTETYYNSGDIRFLTEKLYKPIMHKHPFILISTPYCLQLLNEQGYKTFNGIIDESYDTELDDCKRFEKIIAEVERLCNLNETQLNDFVEKCLPIVEHNYKNFFEKQIQINTLI